MPKLSAICRAVQGRRFSISRIVSSLAWKLACRDVANLSDVIIGLKVLSHSNPVLVFSPANDVNSDGVLGMEDVIYELQETAGLR